MPAYWFRPKRYGYGATPVTWQGWAVTLATVLAMVAVSLYLRHAAPQSLWGLAMVIGFDVLAIATLVVISYRKTEGGWRWRWGDR